MQSELNTKVISENLSSYSYYLNITDSTHPLHYLKTPLIDNTSNNNKKQTKSSLGSGILYVALILITGSIFLFHYTTITEIIMTLHQATQKLLPLLQLLLCPCLPI